jgi:micrococcal nuclease
MNISTFLIWLFIFCKTLAVWSLRLPKIEKFLGSPNSNPKICYGLAIVSTSLALGLSLSTPMINNANDVKSSMIKDRKEISAKVVKVVDGDTIRVRHRRYPWSSGSLDAGQTLSEGTISVRLYAVDAPETAKRGLPGQPYADAATEFVYKKTKDKSVHVKMLSKDQYGRIVAVVKYDTFLGRCVRDLSEELLKEGLAVIYRGGGARYDGQKKELTMLEMAARKRKVGLWSSDQYMETPTEYKKRTKKMHI